LFYSAGQSRGCLGSPPPPVSPLLSRGLFYVVISLLLSFSLVRVCTFLDRCFFRTHREKTPRQVFQPYDSPPFLFLPPDGGLSLTYCLLFFHPRKVFDLAVGSADFSLEFPLALLRILSISLKENSFQTLRTNKLRGPLRINQFEIGI